MSEQSAVRTAPLTRAVGAAALINESIGRLKPAATPGLAKSAPQRRPLILVVHNHPTTRQAGSD